MFKLLQALPVPLLLVIATTLEVSGDAAVRLAIYRHAGLTRIGVLLAGATLLLGYGLALNTAPVEFGRVVGLNTTTLFIVWQVIHFIVFHAQPTRPVVVGGALAVC